jgi:CheY-like chemotaxis protein
MGHRLLVVDSDRRFIQDHKASLESAFEVDFRNGTEGSLAHLETGGFAAVLLCVEASENKGYSLCSAIRRSPALADLKVALISAKATPEEYARHQSLKGRADLYLHKPIRPNALVSALTPFVPLKPDDPDNPLGDLGGDLGDEWLESLKSELEIETAPGAPSAPSPAPATPLLSASALLAGRGSILAMPQAPPKPPPMAENTGRIELLEARVRDLETKLVANADALENSERELARVRDERAEGEQDLARSQEALAASEQARVQAEQARAEAEQGRAEAEQGRAEAEQALGQTGHSGEEARRQLDEKTQLAMDLMESNQLLQAQLAEAREDHERLSQALREAQAAAGELETARDGAQAARAERERDLQSQLAEARAEQERLERSGQELRDQLEQARQAGAGELEALRREAAAALEDRERLERERQSQLGELREAKDQLERSLQDQLAGAWAAKDQLEQSLRAELAGAWEVREQQEQALRGQLADAADELYRRGEAERSLQERNRELERARDEAQAGRDQAAQAQSALEQRLAGIEQDHERQQMELMAAIDDRDAQLVRSNAILDALRAQVQQLEQDKQAAEAAGEQRSGRLRQLAEQLAGLESQARQAAELARSEMP